MTEFEVNPEGWVRDLAVYEAAQRQKELFPETDVLTYQVSTLIIRVFRAIKESREAALAATGLTTSRLPILETLYRSPEGRLTVGELARALRVTPTNISKLVDNLKVDGWLTRAANPNDGRSVQAELTEWGRTRLEEVVPWMSAGRVEMLAVLSDDEKQILIHLLAKVHMNVLSKFVRSDDLLSPGLVGSTKA